MCSIPPSSPEDSVRACKHAGSGHTSEVAVTFANPVDGPRIVPYGEPRKPTDVLPNRHLGFRVTQRFTDVNPAFPQFGQHQAMDVGNYVGGDNVKAMAAGTVTNVYTDNAGARIVLLTHAGGYTTLYAHLQDQAVRKGANVTERQLIGHVGNTGLGAVYHLHVEVRRNGVKVDPWPLLRQNQLPDTSVGSGDPMLDFIPEPWTVGPAGAVVYDTPNGQPTGQQLPAGTPVTTIGEPSDPAWRQILVSPTSGARKAAYAKRAELKPLGRIPAFEDAVWSLLLSRKAPTATDSQDNKIRGARTAVDGAAQAIAAAQRSLA